MQAALLLSESPFDLNVNSASLLLQGIQFFDLKLVGAGISLTRGLGFTIRKLGKLNGVSCLHSSQPLCQMSVPSLHVLAGHSACLSQPYSPPMQWSLLCR